MISAPTSGISFTDPAVITYFAPAVFIIAPIRFAGNPMSIATKAAPILLSARTISRK